MTESRRRLLEGLALGALTVLVFWGGNHVLVRAQQVMGSTFEFQYAQIALAQAIWFAAGGVFATVLELGRRRRDSSAVAHLVSGAIFPLLVIAVFWLWVSPAPISVRPFQWILSSSVQTAAAVSAGVLLTAAVLRRYAGTADSVG
jgi:hypothetical protein